MRKYDTRILKGYRGNILVILIVSPFFFMVQSNYTRAQDNQLERRRTNRESGNLKVDRNRDFYRVVVENNLFRPLGWRELRREPEYVLIATWIESRGETAKALLMERGSNQTYYVTLGEKVGNATIEKIESKRVNLNISGEILTLKVPSIQFLNSRQFLNEPSQSLHGHPTQSAAVMTSPRNRQTRMNRNQRNHRQNRDGGRQSWRQRARDEFRNATPEDRRKLIEMLRQL